MSWNQIKNDEKQSDTQKAKFADKKPDISGDKVKKVTKDVESKADKQLFILNNTFENMINTSNKVEAAVEASLTGFYKEISKSIKKK
jgi:bisphosphoglycerate-independent phosphoglycerate mutase (AlkP superfamily)